MHYTLIARSSAVTICIFLMLAMFLMFWIGWYLRRRLQFDKGETKGGIVSIQSALLGLFGFILGFTFSMAGNRYDYIRNIFIDESNTIGTAVLRSDLYSDSVRNVFKLHFREYVEARITLYENPFDTAHVRASKLRGENASGQLWQLAMDQSKRPNMFIPSNQMVPALNEMFDVGAKRDILLRTRIPDIIIYMLLILALLISFTAGITFTGEFNSRDMIIMISFIVFTSLIIYITLDLGRPLRGVIRTGAAEESFRNLRLLFRS